MSGARRRTSSSAHLHAYRVMLRSGAPRHLREAADAACPYRRQSYVDAFHSGFYAWVTVRHLESDFTVPHLSPAAQRAWVKGHKAREQYESNTTQEA